MTRAKLVGAGIMHTALAAAGVARACHARLAKSVAFTSSSKAGRLATPSAEGTRMRGEAVADLSRLTGWLGNIPRPPAWLLNLLAALVIPMFWRELVNTFSFAVAKDSLWASRVTRDKTGLYTLVRRSIRQFDR